jgi:hypothetical protein
MASKDLHAKKGRIISHLNNDHQASLSLYLRHYAHLSSHDASSPTLLDISLSSMSIQDRIGAVHRISIDPPMKSWAEAREKTVAMDREAREALGVPMEDHIRENGGRTNGDVRITEYSYPQKPFHFAVLGILIFYLVSYTAGRFGVLRPGFWYYDYVMRYFPGGPGGYLWFEETIFWPVIGLHFAEACWMGLKLRGQGIQTGSTLWWKWFVSTMIEGFGAHKRFDRWAARKQKQVQSKSH